MQKFLTAMVAGLLTSTTSFASLVSDTTSLDVPASSSFADTPDPLKPYNEFMTDFNEVFDGLVLSPLVGLYHIVVPNEVKEKAHNAISNLSVPYTLINDLLQGEGDRAGESLYRFVINSTLGLGGLFDVAYKHFHIAPHTEDFGQTLAVWGADDGCYLVLPILGPSTLRDTLGLVAGAFLDPVNYVLYAADGSNLVWGRTVAEGFDRRHRGDKVVRYIRDSSNPYKTGKILYLQNREFEIKNGQVDRESPTPDME